MAEMSRVQLIGTDQTIHAKGEIEFNKVCDAPIVKRNERYYRYIGMRDRGVATFKETAQPYLITEF